MHFNVGSLVKYTNIHHTEAVAVKQFTIVLLIYYAHLCKMLHFH